MMLQTAKYMYISFITDFAWRIILGLAKAELVVREGSEKLYYIFRVHMGKLIKNAILNPRKLYFTFYSTNYFEIYSSISAGD